MKFVQTENVLLLLLLILIFSFLTEITSSTDYISSKETGHMSISLPGDLMYMNFELKRKTQLTKKSRKDVNRSQKHQNKWTYHQTNMSMTVKWMLIPKTNIFNFDPMPITCKLFLKYQAELCFRFFAKEPNYYFVIGNISNYEKEKKSWDEAAELCHKIGWYLSYFTSRDKLNEFISLLRYSPHVPPMEAMYIGLKYNVTEVSEM